MSIYAVPFKGYMPVISRCTKKEKAMKEAYAITGYVPNAVAKSLSSGLKNYSGKIEVKLDAGSSEFLARVDPAHVAEVRTGSSKGGETIVQIILRNKADVETVLNTTLNKSGIARLNDPVLAARFRAPVFVIMV
jgi:hypothetical protein